VSAVSTRAPSKLDVTKTDADGTFTFPALPAGSYTFFAEDNGQKSRPVAGISLAEGERKRIDLVVGAADQMTFSDAPDFTVAGVTDWTAVGGHGSDSILRTSEELARETAALKAQGTGPTQTGDAESESKLRAALAGSPGSFQANHQLGDFYLAAARYREALPLLDAAYRIDAANGANERDLAQAYEGAGDWTKAREHVRHLMIRNRDADLHRMAGDLDEKLSDPLGAVEEYREAVGIEPSEQNYLAWGSELLLHRAVWQATEVFRQGVKAHPQSARLLTGLGTALFAGAVYDEAAQRLCEASDLEPANPEPYIFMGKVDMAAPSPLPCVPERLARFVREKPDSSLANYFYAMALEKRNQLSANTAIAAQVETLLKKAVALDAKCSDGYLQLGILAASEREYERAVPLYTKALDIDPELSEAHYRLGVAYDRLGEREKAAREFQLHDELKKQQAAAVEQRRREVKQFVVVNGSGGKQSVQ
jgi:tetratricopeptide (TPR) repeat protein